MKRTLFFVVLFCALLPGSQAVALSLSLSPASADIILGDELTFSLDISGLTEGGPPSLGAFRFNLSYDSMILAFSSVTFGNYLGNPDNSEFYKDSTPGNLYLDEVSWLSEIELDSSQPAAFSLANLTLTAIGLGTSDLVFANVDLSDASGASLSDVTLNSASITVSSASVPEPAPVILLTTGMVVLGIFGRKGIKKARL